MTIIALDFGFLELKQLFNYFLIIFINNYINFNYKFC